MNRWVVLAVAVGLCVVSACLQSAVTNCDNGVVCPSGSTCSATVGCVLDKQLQACDGLAEGAACTYGDFSDAHCIDGACIELRCGDGLVSGTEQCDGGLPANLVACTAHGFYGGGQVSCTRSCSYDYAACTGWCGDGILDSQEACDPGAMIAAADDVLDGKNCTDFGFYAALGLACSSACTFAIDECMHHCGDGVLDVGEDCDDGGTAGTTADDVFRGDCRSLGYYTAATIRCNSNCGYDDSACEGFCGDGLLNGAEDCDDRNTLVATDDVFAGDCLDLGFYTANTIKCSPSCNYDDSSCVGTCGDRVLDTSHDELCEGMAPPGQGCVNYGYESGPLGCVRLCGPDFSRCSHPWTAMDPGAPSTLYDVWGTGPNDVFATGLNGSIRHYNGTTWSGMTSGTTNGLYALWGASSTDVFVVGVLGVIRRYNGSTWSAMASGTTSALHDVWGSSASDVFAVGDGGTIVHYNGSAWSTMTSGTTQQLLAVWGTSSADVFAVGIGGTILHYNGSVWSPMTSGVTGALQGIWGSASNNVFVAGGSGVILRYNGSTWSTQTTNTTTNIRAIWGSGPNDVFAMADGPSLHWDGAAWTALPTSVQLSGQLALWGSGPGNIWAAGGGVFHWTQSGWFTMANAAPNANFGVWGLAPDDVFAVGAFGSIQRFDGSAWTAMTSNTSSNLFSVSGSGPNDVFAVGSFGGLVHWNGSTWTAMSVTSEHLYGVWVRTATDAFAVGFNGVIFRWNGSVWSPMTSGTTEPLNSVWGTGPDDVWAVGNNGVIRHWNGLAWSPVSSGTGQFLYGVWGSSADDVFAVGGFTIQHWNGSTWSAMSSPASPVWLGVSGTGPTDVFAVGQNGSLQHWDGAQWAVMATPSATTSLQGVWAGSDVFVAGGAKTIMRRARHVQPGEQACNDGNDDDFNGAIDCSDSDCAGDSNCTAGGVCSGAITLACDATVAGTTVGAASNIDAYDCDPWEELGRERIYRLTPATSGAVTVSLTGLTKDLDLIVLAEGTAGGCDLHHPGCLGASSTTGSESVTFTATAGRDYYLVVDGYGSNAGSFTLDANCP